jgi:DNA mismatch endonuclease (patch repair protein)
VISTRQQFKQLEKRLTRRSRPTTTTSASLRMGRVRQRGTEPELAVRRVAAAMGWRYRTSNRDLPGSPDLANRTRKWAVFVHGCFWHRHEGCSRATVPKANRSFWLAKFSANRRRDKHAIGALQNMGFRVAIVWECETRSVTLISHAFTPVEPAAAEGSCPRN